MKINDLTGTIIGAAMKVHTALGPGLLESAYEACLAHELRKMGLRVQSQVELPSSMTVFALNWDIVSICWSRTPS